MKEVYDKTISTIFIVPTLKIDRELLFKNNFINAFIGDIDEPDYHHEEVIFLVFKPKSEKEFNSFLDKQYEDNEFIIHDYAYDNFIVVVYQIDKKFEEDIQLIIASKYSKVSDKFKAIFPKKVKNFNSPENEMIESIQHLIFNRDERLVLYWENNFNTDNISRYNLEAWPEFNPKKEVLDIDLLKSEYENN